MTLLSGARLGQYEILAALGAGGMGEVYRARDSKLNRDVALKILPDTFAADAERIARFRREAQVLASLNHPNIGHIYGLEDSTTPPALVLELIEGPTLADRIAQGPIPLDEALPIARQIAEALEAAHEHGVIHRDLKPANVKVREDDTVKVLDFGLAKAFDPAATSSAEALNSPTLTMRATQLGLVLGTAAYMSPEQAKGKSVDRRADIWAFGAVLYEMLSGKRPFEGDDISDTLAAVLRQEVNWNALPASTPAAVKRLIMRCLERDVRRRLRDIGEARIVLEDPSTSAAAGGDLGTSDSGAARIERRRPLWKRALPVAAAATLAALLAGPAGWYLKPSPAAVVTRFSLTLPEGRTFTSPARHFLNISPDGTEIVYVGNSRLYLRKIWEIEAQPIAGTDGFGSVTEPVFSPDGHSIVFWAAADSTIKRISTAGGVAVTLCQSSNPWGMSWSDDGIVFGEFERGVVRVSATGGKPETIVPARPGDLLYGPQLLPGGQQVLMTFARASGNFDRWDKAQIVVASLTTGDHKVVVDGGADARYLPTGHLVYAIGGVEFAARFDLSRLQVVGQAVPVLEGIARAVPTAATGAAHFAVSRTGTLVFVPGPASPSIGAFDIALIDRRGIVKPLNLPRAAYSTPRVSPDGSRIAFVADSGQEAFVAVYDLTGATALRRLTLGGTNRFPIWTADSKRVVYQSDRDGDLGMFWQPADGTGTAERLTKPNAGESHFPEAWSAASNTLFFSVVKGSENTLWTLSMPEGKIAPFDAVRSIAVPINAALSPDGLWLAYQTDHTRRTTVYVQPVPPTGSVFQLFPRGADQPHEPVWSPDGKELFYNPRAGGFESVPVSTQPEFGFGNPASLPRPFQLDPPQARRSYDVTPGGMFVGVIIPGGTNAPAGSEIEVVVNWFDELNHRVSAQ